MFWKPNERTFPIQALCDNRPCIEGTTKKWSPGCISAASCAICIHTFPGSSGNNQEVPFTKPGRHILVVL